VKQFGNDSEKYRALYEPNLSYIYVPHGTLAWYIDEEAKSIAIPNNDVRFLEKCVELLSQPAEAAKARRLLERYTGLSFADAKHWRQWLENNREKLYFSDFYDYRFYTGPADSGALPIDIKNAGSDLKLEEPTNDIPVRVGATVVTSAQQGGLVTIVVRLKIANGWYIAAPKRANVPQIQIDLDLPAGARWYGEWQPLKIDGTGKLKPGEYRGDILLTRQLYFAEKAISETAVHATKKLPLRGILHYVAVKGKRRSLPMDAPFEAAGVRFVP